MVKFKARRGRVAAQIHGNTRLEIGWTIGAAVILVFITAVTFIKLPGIKDPAASDIDAQGNPVAANALFASTDQQPPPKGDELRIVVDGQQYVWRYQYPAQGDKTVFAYEEMVVPVGMTVLLDHHRRRRRPLVVDPGARRQDGRGPRLHEQDLVQGHQAGPLQGPVRRAVRAQPRQHDRPGPGRAVRRVPARGSTSEAADIKTARDEGARQREELLKSEQEAAQQSE